jgi:hypothetical protein
MSFDSLTFARRLKAAGFTDSQAEALADANREMVVHDLATKDDIEGLRSEIGQLRSEMRTENGQLRSEMTTENGHLRSEMSTMKHELLTLIEHQTLRITVRMGIMLAAGLSLMTAVTGTLIKFH